MSNSQYTDSSIAFGKTYYYAVTATDGSSNESEFSTKVKPTSALLAYWDFNDRRLGAAHRAAVPDSDGYRIWRTAAYDKSGNGNDLTTWDFPDSGFMWSKLSSDGGFSIKSAGNNPSAFTASSETRPRGVDVEKFTGTEFTVEALTTVTGSGYRSVLCRDAQNLANFDASYAALSLGLDDVGHARFYYADVNRNYVELRSETTFPDSGNKFHHIAATSDGSTVSLYVDGVLVAQKDGARMAGLGIGTTSGEIYHAGGWAVGRSLFANGHVDRWHGYIDSVSISEMTLGPGTFVLSDASAPGVIDTPPDNPMGLAATAGDGTVTLDWADSGEPDFAFYTVYRSTTPGVGYAPIRVGLTTSEYTDPSAGNSVTYYYVVTATDKGDYESQYSPAALATPVDVTHPAAPADLTAHPGDALVELDWADSREPDFASYTVYRSTASDSGYEAIASGLSVSAFVDTSVFNGTTYYYAVASLDSSSLNSSNSREVSATPVATKLLSGTVIGSPGSFGGEGNTRANVFDGDLATYYDALNASGDWSGLDLGSPKPIRVIRYSPRGGWAARMEGGRFQGSNTADFSSGVVTLFTIGEEPAEGVLTSWTASDPGAYRYVRYIGSADAYCNIAEVEFHTVVVPQYRTWNSADGSFRTEAMMGRVEGDTVSLRTRDGIVRQVPVKSLSDNDQRYLAEEGPPPPGTRIGASHPSSRVSKPPSMLGFHGSAMGGNSSTSLPFSSPKFRLWTRADGSVLAEAALFQVEGGTAYLFKSDGDIVRVDIESLSAEDRRIASLADTSLRADSSPDADVSPAMNDAPSVDATRAVDVVPALDSPPALDDVTVENDPFSADDSGAAPGTASRTWGYISIMIAIIVVLGIIGMMWKWG